MHGSLSRCWRDDRERENCLFRMKCRSFLLSYKNESLFAVCHWQTMTNTAAQVDTETNHCFAALSHTLLFFIIAILRLWRRLGILFLISCYLLTLVFFLFYLNSQNTCEMWSWTQRRVWFSRWSHSRGSQWKFSFFSGIVFFLLFFWMNSQLINSV